MEKTKYLKKYLDTIKANSCLLWWRSNMITKIGLFSLPFKWDKNVKKSTYTYTDFRINCVEVDSRYIRYAVHYAKILKIIFYRRPRVESKRKNKMNKNTQAISNAPAQTLRMNTEALCTTTARDTIYRLQSLHKPSVCVHTPNLIFTRQERIVWFLEAFQYNQSTHQHIWLHRSHLCMHIEPTIYNEHTFLWWNLPNGTHTHTHNFVRLFTLFCCGAGWFWQFRCHAFTIIQFNVVGKSCDAAALNVYPTKIHKCRIYYSPSPPPQQKKRWSALKISKYWNWQSNNETLGGSDAFTNISYTNARQRLAWPRARNILGPAGQHITFWLSSRPTGHLFAQKYGNRDGNSHRPIYAAFGQREIFEFTIYAMQIIMGEGEVGGPSRIEMYDKINCWTLAKRTLFWQYHVECVSVCVCVSDDFRALGITAYHI